MVQYTKGKLKELSDQGRVALGNALDTPEIQGLLAGYNYDAAKLQEGRALFQGLEERQAAQLRLYAQQKEATAAFKTAWSAARKTYMRHVKIARALLAEEPERLARLGLEGERSRTFGVWLGQAQQFYREGLSDAGLQETLAQGGLTREVLENGQAAVEAVAKADAAQESAKGLAQQSTKDRDAAADAFQQWMRNFWKIAEVALSGQPQWLERLGRMVRS